MPKKKKKKKKGLHTLLLFFFTRYMSVPVLCVVFIVQLYRPDVIALVHKIVALISEMFKNQ